MKSTVSEKGQVTIPKKLRDRLGIRPGTTLDFEEDGGRLIATKRAAGDAIAAVYGRFPSKRSTDEMMVELRGEADSV